MTTKGKIFTWAGIILALALAGFIYFRFYFVFGDGVKAGELNQFIYKGYVWKTYEGKLIQAGFRGSNRNTGGRILYIRFLRRGRGSGQRAYEVQRQIR